MSNISGPDDRLLERYLAGETTAEQRAMIERWLASDDALAARVTRLRHPSALVGRRRWATHDEWTRLRHAAAAERAGWERGRLVFDDVSLPQAAAEVGRWYDVDVTIADSVLARRHVTAVFSTPTLDGVLGGLSASGSAAGAP